MKRYLFACTLGLFIAAAPAAMAGDVYGLNLRGTANMRVFPSNNPSQMGNILANVDYASFAMDFNSAGTTLYAVKNISTTEWELGTIDTTTAAYSPIVAVTGANSTPTGLKVDPTDETFYLSTGTMLYTLNTTTGVLTSRGAFTGTPLMIDIAIDANGNMYGHDIGTDSLYSIDKNTAQTTLIGAHGLAANFAQGMDFDYDTNTLYAAIYTGGGTGKYVSWNLNDGSVNQLIDTLQFNVEMEMAINSPIPEPASMCLLALGGLALIRRR